MRWLRPLPVQLQVHVSPQLGLGEGSHRFLGRLALEWLQARTGHQAALWGVVQGNEWPRCLYHSHGLLFGSEALREAPRVELARYLEDQQLSPAWRPHEGEFPKELRVSVKPVQLRGDGPDSLVAYCARYMLRQDAGSWYEVGDLSRFMDRPLLGVAQAGVPE